MLNSAPKVIFLFSTLAPLNGSVGEAWDVQAGAIQSLYLSEDPYVAKVDSKVPNKSPEKKLTTRMKLPAVCLPPWPALRPWISCGCGWQGV